MPEMRYVSHGETDRVKGRSTENRDKEGQIKTEN